MPGNRFRVEILSKHSISITFIVLQKKATRECETANKSKNKGSLARARLILYTKMSDLIEFTCWPAQGRPALGWLSAVR
jgi:hypothetical protein